jgi:hypothetical protein
MGVNIKLSLVPEGNLTLKFSITDNEYFFPELIGILVVDKVQFRLMHQDRYPTTASPTKREYEFLSKGKNGAVRKIVQYSQIPGAPSNTYNLAFGDFDEESGEIDDAIVTNNGDARK